MTIFFGIFVFFDKNEIFLISQKTEKRFRYFFICRDQENSAKQKFPPFAQRFARSRTKKIRHSCESGKGD